MAETDGPIWDVLDRAIKEVAEREYQRLSRGLSCGDVAGRVDKALDSLGKLQKREEPDYDCEWVALFYLTWYQPRQINLVYSYLDCRKVELPERLQVVDLGCGLGRAVRAGHLRRDARTAGSNDIGTRH